MSEQMTIQNGVPMPKRSKVGGGARARKYPFDLMLVGHMFFIPNKTKNTLHTYFSTVSKRMGIKLASRMVYMRKDSDDSEWQMCEPTDEGAVLGIGVWRTE